MAKYEGDIGNPISEFENDNGVVEIRHYGNGVFIISPMTGEVLNKDFECQQQIAETLSWWRQQTKTNIISVAGFNGKTGPTLLVVTEILEITEVKTSSDSSQANQVHIDKNPLDILKKIGNDLKDAREQLGLTAGAIAKEIGTNSQTVQAWEKGWQKMGEKWHPKIQEILGINVADYYTS